MGATCFNCYHDGAEPDTFMTGDTFTFDPEPNGTNVAATPPYRKRTMKRDLPSRTGSKRETSTVPGETRMHIKDHNTKEWGVHMDVERDPPWIVHSLDPQLQWDTLGIEPGWQVYKYNNRRVLTNHKDSSFDLAAQLKTGKACIIDFIAHDEKLDAKDIESKNVEKLFSCLKLFQVCLLFLFLSAPSLIGTIFYIVYDDKSLSFVYLFISLGIVLLTMFSIYFTTIELDFILVICVLMIINLNLLFIVQQGSQGIESNEGWSLVILIICFTVFQSFGLIQIICFVPFSVTLYEIKEKEMPES